MIARRSVIVTAAVAAALALAGCSGGGSSGSSTPTASACADLKNEVGNISNGAQNTLAASEISEDAPAYFEELEGRVDTLEDEWSDDDAVSSALGDFADAVEAGGDYVTEPSDGADVTQISADISDTGTAVKDACEG